MTAALILLLPAPVASETVDEGASRLARAWYWAGKEEWHLAILEGLATADLLRGSGDKNLPEALEVVGLSELILGRAQLAFEHLSEGLAACSSCGERTYLQLSLSSALRDLDRFEEAEILLHQVIGESAPSGRQEFLVQAYKGLASIQVKRGRRAPALPFLQKALQFTTGESKPKEVAELHESIGVLLTEASDWVSALQHLRKAEALFKTAGPRSSPWRIQTNIAKAMIASGRDDAAYGLLEEVEAACRKSGDRHELARALSGLGEILERQGSEAAAQTRYEEALALERATGDSLGETTLLGRLSKIALRRGQYGRAFVLSEQIASVSRAPSGRQSDLTALIGSSSVHIALGNEEEGSARFQKFSSLTNAGRTEAPLVQALLEVAQLFLGNRWTEALKRSELALQLARDLNSEAAERDILQVRAALNIVLNAHQEARTDALSALYLSTKLADKPAQAQLKFLLGLSFLLDGKYADAIAALERALPFQPSGFQTDSRARTLWALGAAREKSGDSAGAIVEYREAVEAFDSGLEEVKSDQLLASLGDSALSSYNRLARLLALRGEIEEAFLLSERSRARVTRRYMEDPADTRKPADPALVPEEEELRRRIAALSAELDRAQRRSSSLDGSEALVGLARELDSARRTYGSLLTRVQELSPAGTALRQPSTRSVSEIQHLLDAETTLVKYLLLDDDAFAWVLHRDSIHFVRLKLTSAEAEAKVRELRALISAHENTGVQAYLLYQLLVEPLSPYLQGDKMYLVPDGALQNLPFAALRENLTGGPLFERYSVSILPSASVLPFVLRQRQAGSPRMLALGDPDGSLPGAAAEARAAAALYGAQAVLGEKATVEAITDAARNIDILHIAAHATSDPARPLFSRLKLADGALNVSDILRLDLSAARLVVLSGCETGTGAATGPGEFGGLSRAFLLAGAPAVIATLWPVDDRASGYFMASFYTHLKRGAGPAEALRQAQSALLHSSEWRHPAYWAAFILSGALRSPGPSATTAPD